MDAIQELSEFEQKKKQQNSENENLTKSQILVMLCDDMKFIHDEQDEAYAQMSHNGHYELWPVRSKKMSLILTDRYMKMYGEKVPTENSLKEAASALEAKAVLRGEKATIHTRIAETDNAIYVDLCNDNWEAVEIKKDGWSIISEPPVYFKRSEIMQPLPYPDEDGSVDDIKPFLNYKNDDDYKLIIAWLLSALKENNPFPIMTIQGEQGSAKSTTTKVLRTLIDPSSLPLRALPQDEQTLAISANNTWILSYDNLSGLSTKMSDSLCKMSTGGGLSVRELYTTSEEAIFNIMRPSILNGIDDIAQRPDLLDRSIVINLPSIDEGSRTDEKTFWKKFNDKKSSIIGGLFSVISKGLAEFPYTTLDKYPRMADFAIWITACEKALGWPEGEFMEVYNDNRNKAIDQGIESDPFALAIVELMKNESEWIGNASQLLANASRFIDDRTTKSKAWPTSRSVRNRLRRINPSLKKKGIIYEPWYNQMKRTLKLSSLSSYRHESSNPNGSSNYDDDYDNTGNYDNRHLSSSYYDSQKTSSLSEDRHIMSDDDNYDNYDISEENYTKDGDILL